MKSKLAVLLKKEYIFLLIIVLLGSFLRLQGVFSNSFAFTYDVGRDMLALWNIVYIHKIPLIGATTGLPGVFYGPWWYYSLTPFFLIFSGNPQGIALTMSLVGILSIILAYFVGEKIADKTTGLIFAGVVSASPVMVSLSAQIWNPNIAPLFVLLILILLSKIYLPIKKNIFSAYFLLGILLAFSVDIEIVYGILFSAGIILSLIIVVNKNIKLKYLLMLLLGFIAVSLPRIFFELRHGFIMTKSFVSFFTSENSSQTTQGIVNIIVNRVSILLDQFSSTLTLENKTFGLVLLIIIIVVIILGYKKENKIVKDFIKTFLIVPITFLVGIIFFSHDIWPHYLVGLPIFYIFLFSLSLYLLGKRFSSKLFTIVIFLIIFILNFNPIAVVRSITEPLWIGDASVYRSQLVVIDYVYSQSKGKEFKYVVYTPPVYDYTYQYLFLWYGPKKYHYSPSTQSHLAFFILEPDYQFPKRLSDWLKQRQGDGKIIKSEKLPSGIIIQTRVH